MIAQGAVPEGRRSRTSRARSNVMKFSARVLSAFALIGCAAASAGAQAETAVQAKLIVKAGHAQVSFPQGVAVDSHGDIFIADTNGNTVKEIQTFGSSF